MKLRGGWKLGVGGLIVCGALVLWLRSRSKLEDDQAVVDELPIVKPGRLSEVYRAAADLFRAVCELRKEGPVAFTLFAFMVFVDLILLAGVVTEVFNRAHEYLQNKSLQTLLGFVGFGIAAIIGDGLRGWKLARLALRLTIIVGGNVPLWSWLIAAAIWLLATR